MAWLIIPRSVSIVPNRSSSSVPTQRLGIDRTTSWSQIRSVVGKAEPVRGLIRPPGAVMGQHPRTWFSSTTAGFPRADAAWLLRQISSLETPVDVDIKKYFDTIDHGHLRDFLNRRVTDGVIRRMIDKWLKAGVLEEGRLHRQRKGRPKGAWFRRAFRTSTCTMCWTNGSNGTSGLA